MAVKFHETKTSLGAAVGDAFSILIELRDEIREVCDNMPESLQGGGRYETLDETANTLDFFDSEPDIPESYFDASVTYGSNHRKSQSRSDRRDEAVRMLEAARVCVDSVIGELEESLAETQDDPEDEEDERDAHVADLTQLGSELDDAIEQAESAEFPGMMG